MKSIFTLMLLTVLLVSACSKEHEHGASEEHESHTEAVAKTNMDLHNHSEAVTLSADSLYACPMDAEYVTSDPDTRCPKCEMTLKPLAEVKPDLDIATLETYTCSMHPEFVTSEPTDRCPICEMTVSKVK